VNVRLPVLGVDGVRCWQKKEGAEFRVDADPEIPTRNLRRPHETRCVMRALARRTQLRPARPVPDAHHLARLIERSRPPRAPPSPHSMLGTAQECRTRGYRGAQRGGDHAQGQPLPHCRDRKRTRAASTQPSEAG